MLRIMGESKGIMVSENTGIMASTTRMAKGECTVVGRSTTPQLPTPTTTAELA